MLRVIESKYWVLWGSLFCYWICGVGLDSDFFGFGDGVILLDIKYGESNGEIILLYYFCGVDIGYYFFQLGQFWVGVWYYIVKGDDMNFFSYFSIIVLILFFYYCLDSCL